MNSITFVGIILGGLIGMYSGKLRSAGKHQQSDFIFYSFIVCWAIFSSFLVFNYQNLNILIKCILKV